MNKRGLKCIGAVAVPGAYGTRWEPILAPLRHPESDGKGGGEVQLGRSAFAGSPNKGSSPSSGEPGA